jgi:hypothetical protein
MTFAIVAGILLALCTETLPEFQPEGFEYSLSISLSPSVAGGNRGHAPLKLEIVGRSYNEVPGSSPAHYVYFSVNQSGSDYLAVPKDEISFTGKPHYPPSKPADSFRFSIRNFQL